MNKRDFAIRLSKIRIGKDISARKMSEDLGFNPSYINNIENGVCYPSVDSLWKICDYLQVTPDEFFIEENRTPDTFAVLKDACTGLDKKQVELVVEMAEELKKKHR